MEVDVISAVSPAGVCNFRKPEGGLVAVSIGYYGRFSGRPPARLASAVMATSSVLYAAAKEIAVTCDTENRNFLKCKMEDEEPSACLDKGEAVQSCVLGVLKSAMATCGETFQSYADCIDRQISEEYMFERCRSEEHSFVDCRTAAKSETSVIAATAREEKKTAAKPESKAAESS